MVEGLRAAAGLASRAGPPWSVRGCAPARIIPYVFIAVHIVRAAAVDSPEQSNVARSRTRRPIHGGLGTTFGSAGVGAGQGREGERDRFGRRGMPGSGVASVCVVSCSKRSRSKRAAVQSG